MCTLKEEHNAQGISNGTIFERVKIFSDLHKALFHFFCRNWCLYWW